MFARLFRERQRPRATAPKPAGQPPIERLDRAQAGLPSLPTQGAHTAGPAVEKVDADA